MKAKTVIISAALMAASIFALGLCLKAGIDRFADRERVVTVRGLCEKEVRANKVTWPLVTKTAGSNLGEIYSRIQADNAALTGFLTANGLDKTEIAVNPPSVYDRLTDRYNSNENSARYTVTNVVVVTSDKVDLVRSLMLKQTELMQKGIAVVAGDYNYPITYEYTGLNDIKPEMIADATAKAREAADRFAQDSRSELGKIKTATQGQFSIEDRDQFTPDIKTVRVVTYITYYLKD